MVEAPLGLTIIIAFLRRTICCLPFWGPCTISYGDKTKVVARVLSWREHAVHDSSASYARVLALLSSELDRKIAVR